ncbi:MAG TPA: mechanosensitive ion channel domain-containing protein [Candidatus Limnocylindrales bacterium]|nr:mechanosensitive ion channel domain-containing protein [Candidatus Limnocylindrales bacterium]
MDIQRLINDLAASGALRVIIQIALIVLATLLAMRFAHVLVSGTLNRLFQREVAEGTAQELSAVELERRRQTLDHLAYRSLRVIILVIAFLMVLHVLDLNIGPAIAGLGVVGLSLSLGAQHLVRDYVAGAFILIENQYSKGDVVTIAAVSGTVEDVSLRRTTLRDHDGTVHYVPHGLIQTASNHTRNWAAIEIDLPITYEQDLAALTEAVAAAGKRLATDPKWRAAIFEAPRVASVERLAETGLLVRVSASVAALHRYALPGVARGLVLDECTRRGIVIGWREAPTALADSPARPAKADLSSEAAAPLAMPPTEADG